MSRCGHFEEVCSQLRLEVSQQKERHEAELGSLKAKVQHLTNELSDRKWG